MPAYSKYIAYVAQSDQFIVEYFPNWFEDRSPSKVSMVVVVPDLS